MPDKPFLFLNHEPGRTSEIIDMVQELEQRGFAGIFSSGTPGDNMTLSLALLDRTKTIVVGTGITGIYMRHAHTMATAAALIEELHPGRFMLGMGVTHVPFLEDIGVTFGKPLADMRNYVGSIRNVFDDGPHPPLILAALRRRMTALAGEIGDGIMWANAALSHLPVSLAALPADRPSGFVLSNSAPVCVHSDRSAALQAIRRYLLFYMKLEHYQNYFIEAGYEHEVAAARRALANSDDDAVMAAISERMADDVGVFGTPAQVQGRVADWYAAGINHLVLDPVSANSDDALVATREVFAAFQNERADG